MNIAQLIAACNSQLATINSLAAIEAETGQLTAEQLANFDKAHVELKDNQAKLARQRLAQDTAIETATPVIGNGFGSGPAIHTKAPLKDYPGAKVARLAMSIAAAKGNLADARLFAENEIGDKDVAMAVTTAANSGGSLVPENWASEVIELLTPRTLVRKMGARSVPLPNGSLTIPRQSGGATSQYKGETEKGSVSESKFGDLKMQAKEQISLVAMSNKLIGHAGYRIEQLVLNDMINATAQTQDRAFIRGDGTGDTPTGIRKTAIDAGRVIAFSGSLIATNIDEYLGALMLGLEESNSNMIMPGWMLPPRTARYLKDLKDANGRFQYPEMKDGFLKGLPFDTTTNIPADLGVDSNESEIYLVDFNDVLIGETDTWSIDISKETAYMDSNGDLQLTFQQNMSLLRLVTENDIGFRHLEGLIVGTGVKFNSSYYL